MAFGGFLKQSTAVDILIGPFVDEDNGKTAETGLTLAQADIKLSKNGQALAQKSSAVTATHDSDGYYNCELDTNDTNAVGQLTVIVHKSGALPVRHEYQIVEEAIYVALFASGAISALQFVQADRFIDTSGTPWVMEWREKDTKAVLLRQTMKNTSGENITNTNNVLGRLEKE